MEQRKKSSFLTESNSRRFSINNFLGYNRAEFIITRVNIRVHPATTPLPPPQEASSSRQPQCSCNFNAPCQLMRSRVRTTDSTRVNDVSTTDIECQLSILNVRWKIVRRFEATFSSLSSPRLWLIRGKVRSLPARVEFFSSRFDEIRFYSSRRMERIF